MTKDNEAAISQLQFMEKQATGVLKVRLNQVLELLKAEPATVAREPEQFITLVRGIMKHGVPEADAKACLHYLISIGVLNLNSNWTISPSVEPAAQTQPHDERVCYCGLTESAHCIGVGAEHNFVDNTAEPAVEERVDWTFSNMELTRIISIVGGKLHKEILEKVGPMETPIFIASLIYDEFKAARASSGTGKETKIFQHHVNCSCLPTKPIGSPNCMCRVEFGAGDALGVAAAKIGDKRKSASHLGPCMFCGSYLICEHDLAFAKASLRTPAQASGKDKIILHQPATWPAHSHLQGVFDGQCQRCQIEIMANLSKASPNPSPAQSNQLIVNSDGKGGLVDGNGTRYVVESEGKGEK